MSKNAAAVKKAAAAPAPVATAAAVKKAAVKKVAAPAAKVVVKKVEAVDVPVVAGERRTNTAIPRSQREDAVVKALRKLGAVDAGTAVSKSEMAKKAGLSEFDAYGVAWSKSRLQSLGYVGQAAVEGVRGVCFFVTELGQTKLPSDKVE